MRVPVQAPRGPAQVQAFRAAHQTLDQSAITCRASPNAVEVWANLFARLGLSVKGGAWQLSLRAAFALAAALALSFLS